MAGLIPENTISEVLARTDIVELVSGYVNLEKKSAANHFALCPFHEEDTASFSVSPSKQIFYCFGCHKGGNAIKFIQEIEQLSFPEAVRFLAKRVNIDIPTNDDPQLVEKLRIRKRLLEIMLDAARFFHLQLMSKEGEKARSYLQQRAISVEVAKRFGLGYAPAGWGSLSQHLLSKGYSQEEIMAAGLGGRKKDYYFDFFRNRIIFPIFDRQGNLLAFGGRILDGEGAKFLNSNENAIYHKGRHLYGLNFAKKSKADQIILVEGYFDVISLYLANVDYAVATLGTALTLAQANLLKNQTENVVLCFDADRAGRKATQKAARLLKRAGVNVKVLLIPEGKDPDDYIREYGPARFLALLSNTIEPLAFELEMIKQESFDQNGKLEILLYQNKACDLLAGEENAILREIYAAEIAKTIGTTTSAVLTEIARRINLQPGQKTFAPQNYPAAEQAVKAKEKREINNDEISLLLLISENNEVLPELDFVIEPEDFSEKSLQILAADVLKDRQDEKYGLARLLAKASAILTDKDQIYLSLMEASMNAAEIASQSLKEEAIKRLFYRLRSERFDRELNDLLQKVRDSNEAELKHRYMQEYKDKQSEAIKWKQKRY